MTESLSVEKMIESRIYSIRGQRVMLDYDLATLYGVTTKNLIKAVRRNLNRFPEDFIFQLSRREITDLQLLEAWGGRRYLPYVFTEHGAVMAANVLRSERAVNASIYVVRAFVKLRQMIASHKELAAKIDQLEHQVATHDKAIVSLFDAIRRLITPPPVKEKKIGFVREG